MIQRLTWLLVCFFLVSGTAIADEKQVVAQIGEKQVTMADFDRWMTFNSESTQKEVMGDSKKKETMLTQIITAMVISDIARQEGFNNREDIQEKMQLMLNHYLALEYLDKVISKQARVSEEDIQKYYEENKERFSLKESVRARHILIKTNKTMTEQDREAAKKKLENILDQIKKGSDFAELASQYSEDTATNIKGGDLGFFNRGRMVPQFEDAAFSLNPGEVSGIIETAYGYHIIKVEERRPETTKPLSEVKNMIVKTLELEKKKEYVDQYIVKAMEAAKAEIYPGKLAGEDVHTTK
jgi:peptidyl-prolyl cis-trans isomerase C